MRQGMKNIANKLLGGERERERERERALIRKL